MLPFPGKGKIYNLTLPTHGEVEFFDIPQNTTHFTCHARNGSEIHMSFNDEPEYITIPAKGAYFEQNITWNGMLGFIANLDNEIMEIVIWSNPS